MQLSKILAILSASAVGTAQTVKAFGDYGVWIPQWDFEVTPGGDHVVLNGTVEQVMDHLQASNPKLMASFNLFGEDGRRAVEKRDETDPLPPSHFRPDCDKDLQLAKVHAWESGMDYLARVPGKPVNGPGPGECGRVSCSYNTGIWWCNDDTKTKTLSTFRHIADGARAAYNECTDWKYRNVLAHGRAFHKTDNWNVVVRGLNPEEARC